MPGFDPTNPPIRPGFYSIVRATVAEAVAPGAGSVVCLVGIHDFGPQGAATAVSSIGQFQKLFGTTMTDLAYTVQGLMRGNGETNGRASEVYIYRLDPTNVADAAASLVIQNTGDTNAITLTAKYAGTFGNQIKVTTRTHPTISGTNQLLVYVGNLLVETFNYAATNITALAALINNATTGSGYLSAGSVTSGTALKAAAAAPLTSGTNGTAAAGDYANALAAVEGVPANHYLLSNMTDGPTIAGAVAWIQNLNASVRRAFLWIGGGASEAVSTAVTRSLTASTVPEVINAGGTSVVDLQTNSTKTTAQFLGYLCGIGAGFSTRRSMTYARIPGFRVVTRHSNTDVEAAIQGGVMVLTQDDDGMRVEKGITCYTSDSDVDMPRKFYSDLRSVRVVHRIDTDLERLTRLYWIGQTSNTETTRAAYIGTLKTYFEGLESEDVLVPGTSTVDLDSEADNSGDTWHPVYSITRAQSIERVLSIGTMS